MKAIIAVAKDYAMGLKGGLPWTHLPRDMKNFKDYTMGKCCVVGRKTFEDLPKLKGRTFYVVTSEPERYENTEDVTYGTLENVPNDSVVIGGGSIYNELLHLCDEVKVTIIDVEGLKADTYFNPFPTLSSMDLDVQELEIYKRDEENKYTIDILTFR